MDQPLVVRPALLFLTLGVFLVELIAAIRAPLGEDMNLALYWLAALPGGVLFWMLVMVRGEHGFMGKLVGVERDRDLRLSGFGAACIAIGVLLLLIGFSMQSSSPKGFWLFCAGLALAAAGSTQLRRDLED